MQMQKILEVSNSKEMETFRTTISEIRTESKINLKDFLTVAISELETEKKKITKTKEA